MALLESLIKDVAQFEHERVKYMRSEITSQIGITAAAVAGLWAALGTPPSNYFALCVWRIAWVLSLIGVVTQGVYLARALLIFRTMHAPQPDKLRDYYEQLVEFYSKEIRTGEAQREADAAFEQSMAKRWLQVAQTNHVRNNCRGELLFRARVAFVATLVCLLACFLAENLHKLF